MRIDETGLNARCCPVGRSALRRMAGPDLDRLNEDIALGRARHASGQPVTEALTHGLVTSDGASFYRIDAGVPVLLPALRITLGEARSPAPVDEDAFNEGPWASYWEALSTRWDDLRPPRRPAPEDIAALQAVVDDTLAKRRGAGLVALILGVTREIATMRWPAGTRLFAIDSSAAMIRNVWPAREVPHGIVVRGDWRTMPFRDGVFDVVFGDASISAQPYPGNFREVTGEVRRVLRDGGVVATRAYTLPEEREPLETIFSDLRAGRIRTLDLLRWRLAAALHGDRATGAKMGASWDAWEANVPDPRGLLASLGLPPERAQVMENLRGGQATLVFPTLAELRESLVSGFDEIACEFPGYPDGHRYPTLVLRSRARPTGPRPA